MRAAALAAFVGGTMRWWFCTKIYCSRFLATRWLCNVSKRCSSLIRHLNAGESKFFMMRSRAYPLWKIRQDSVQRDIATYVEPHVLSDLPMSITIGTAKDDPCDLWMVIANDNASGNCSRLHV